MHVSRRFITLNIFGSKNLRESVLKKQESHSGSGVDPPLMCGWEGQENDSIFFSFGSKNEKYVK